MIRRFLRFQMKQPALAFPLLTLATLLSWQMIASAETFAPLEYNEVREVIRAQLPGVTDAELDLGAL